MVEDLDWITKKIPRSERAESFIESLRIDVAGGRASGFDRALLEKIETNPDLTIRECWEQVEDHFAQVNRVSPRLYTLRFEN